MAFRQAFKGTGDGVLIATGIEGWIALFLMLARVYTTWRITKRVRSDLYLALAALASASILISPVYLFNRSDHRPSPC